MARKTVTEMKRFKDASLKGYEAIWTHVRAKSFEPYTLYDIEKDLNCHVDAVRDYVKRLIRAGYVEEIGQTERKGRVRPINIYRNLKLPAVAPRLRRDGTVVTQGSGRDYMWRTMKMLGTFNATELAINATTKV